MADETPAPEADETVPAETPAESETTEAAPSEAPVEDETVPAEEVEAAPEEPAAEEGDHIRKPDASPSSLDQLLLAGEHITSELLDEIEKRCDVSDVRYLVAFCRRLLGAQEG